VQHAFVGHNLNIQPGSSGPERETMSDVRSGTAATAQCSVVINNHNYAAFLGAAIDSALAQVGTDVEVVVVDDGSVDDSRDVIASYGAEITSILQPNRGQASAINAGYDATSAECVIFLDADDVLADDAAATALAALDGMTKVHWRLAVVDADGVLTGNFYPGYELSGGDRRVNLRTEGPESCRWAPTSGNAWSREFLDSVMPVPEEMYRGGADTYLCVLAAATGPVGVIPRPLTFYRQHGGNFWASDRLGFDHRVEQGLDWLRATFPAVAARLEMPPETVDEWLEKSWWAHLRRARETIRSTVPEPERLLVLDDDAWQVSPAVAGRQCRPYPRRDRGVWGPAESDAVAIAELEEAMNDGFSYLAVAMTSWWWFDYYRAWAAWLDEHACVAADAADVRIFRLTRAPRDRDR
jgi:hypothetical protein